MYTTYLFIFIVLSNSYYKKKPFCNCVTFVLKYTPNYVIIICMFSIILILNNTYSNKLFRLY